MSRTVPGFVLGLLWSISGCGGSPGPSEGTPKAPSAAAPASPAPPRDWTEFSPSDRAFTVLLPTGPEERTSTEKLEDGSDLTHHIFIAADKPQSYLVDRMEVPFDVAEEGRKGLYDGMRDENVASRKAKTLEEKDITVDGFAGRERVDEQPLKGGTLLTRTRSVLVGRQYFLVMATYFPGPLPPGVDRFLGSFHPAQPAAQPAGAAAPADAPPNKP